MPKYPFTKQESYNECGSACISMLFKYYKGYLSLKTIDKGLHLTKYGTSAYNIIKFLRSYNFESYGIKENLKETKIPFIINYQEHFMLVYKVTKKFVYLADPKDKVKKIKTSDFIKIFNNIKIIAIPKKKLPKEKKFSLLKTPIFEKKYVFVVLFILAIFSSISSIYTSFLLEDLINKRINSLLSIGFLILITSTFLKIKIISYYSDLVYKNILKDIFKNILYLPYYYFKNSLIEEILSKISNLKIVKELLIKILSSIFTSIFNLFFSSVVLFILNKKLFLILVFFTLLYLIINKTYKKQVNENINNYYQKIDNEYSFMNEMISKYESVNNLNIHDKIYQNFLKLNDYTFYSSLKNNKSLIFRNFHLTILSIVFTILIYVYGTKIINNFFPLTSLITFIIILNIFLESLDDLLQINTNIRELKTILRKAYALKENKLKDLNKGTINYQNVNLLIDDKIILNNINLKINKNEKIFVTGPSGSGKSTLFKLLMNYYKFEGNITSSKINYVSLEDKLFSGRIIDNLNLKGNKLDKNKLLKLDDINEKELLFNYLLYDSNISSGQIERIVLARALEDCDTLIIDESLSLVESDKERIILKNILKLDKTIIFISHRLDNLDLFDRYITMDHGKIIIDERRR